MSEQNDWERYPEKMLRQHALIAAAPEGNESVSGETVTIQFGHRSQQAVVLYRQGVLVVHEMAKREPDGYIDYTVTHAPTGRSIRHTPRLDWAIDLTQRLNGLVSFDWATLETVEQVLTLPPAQKSEIQNVITQWDNADNEPEHEPGEVFNDDF